MNAVLEVGFPHQALFVDPVADPEIQLDPGNYTRVDIIYNRCQTSWSAAGISAVRDFLTGDAFGVDEDNIVPQGYVPTGSGTGEPNSNSPSGLAVVQVRQSQFLAVCYNLMTVSY